MSNQQTVYRLTHQKDFSGLTPTTEPIPTAAPHEVVIKTRSVALNFRDLAIATSTYPGAVKDNPVPCSDVAGDIIEVGPGVDGLKVGDKVVCAFAPSFLYGAPQGLGAGLGAMHDGVLREYVNMSAQAVVKVKEDAPQSYGELASLVCTGVTVWNALYGNMPLKPGQVVLCQGTGGVSITSTIFARAAGATVIITSSSDDKLKLAKEKYGAHHVINYKKTPDWAEEALKLTNGRGVDYIIENGGSGTIAQSIKAITPGGIISCIGFLAPAKQENMPDVALLAVARGFTVRGIQVGSVQQLEETVRFVSERGIRMPVEKEFGFDRDSVIRAFEFMKSGGHVGKVCITVL